MATGIEGKVAVITGGASGIGKAAAFAFAKEGARVVIVTAHSVKAGEAVARQIRETGGEALFVQCDVSREAQVEAMVTRTVAEFGAIDFAFNNAGVGPDGVTIQFNPLTDIPKSDWDWIIDTNLKGVFLCLKHELRQMRKQGSGVIVNTASIGGLILKPNGGAYGTSKAGVIAITKVAALENKDLGIRVHVVLPAGIRNTGMSERLVSSLLKNMSPDEKLKWQGGGMASAKGQPDDVARAVVWLCSEETSYINGAVLSIDGGIGIA